MSEPSERKREKKRKHNSDDAERSHKKRALEAPPATVRVSLLQDVGDLAPAIGKLMLSSCYQLITAFPRCQIPMKYSR